MSDAAISHQPTVIITAAMAKPARCYVNAGSEAITELQLLQIGTVALPIYARINHGRGNAALAVSKRTASYFRAGEVATVKGSHIAPTPDGRALLLVGVRTATCPALADAAAADAARYP